MNVGYCSVQNGDIKSFVSWEALDKLPAQNETEFFRPVRFPSPLTSKMDGKQQIVLVTTEK